MTDHIPTIHDRLADELDEALDAAGLDGTRPIIEPSDEERRNGWDAESLSDYVASREAGAALAVDVNSIHRSQARRPMSANHRYRPLRWRG